LNVLPVDTALCQKGPDLGGNRFKLLTPPRVAIASQWPIGTTSFGSVWFLLDQRLGLRASPVNVQRLGGIDLRRYNVLILPNAWSTAGFKAVLNEQVRKMLRSWVESGGTLIALGRSAMFLAGEEHALGSVRLKRDVLDKLELYEEDLEREESARNVQVELQEIWDAPSIETKDDDSSTSKERSSSASAVKRDVEALKRQDAWQRMFRPSGAILAAQLDPEHWLSFGLGDRVPVFMFGDHARMSKHPVRTPARLAGEADLRLSGLLWPEARSRWAETAYATVERFGRGQIILFASDPFFRGYSEGSGRLLLNAVILGPGMGTSQPAPW
jgi:hypothetical protein